MNELLSSCRLSNNLKPRVRITIAPFYAKSAKGLRLRSDFNSDKRRLIPRSTWQFPLPRTSGRH
jgi:hypothetical protein